MTNFKTSKKRKYIELLILFVIAFLISGIFNSPTIGLILFITAFFIANKRHKERIKKQETIQKERTERRIKLNETEKQKKLDLIKEAYGEKMFTHYKNSEVCIGMPKDLVSKILGNPIEQNQNNYYYYHKNSYEFKRIKLQYNDDETVKNWKGLKT